VISVFELGQCRIGQVTRLHIVRPGGRALCGMLIAEHDLYVDVRGGWEMWRTWRNRRCKRCEAETSGWVPK
jgi:hypothetical protein